MTAAPSTPAVTGVDRPVDADRGRAREGWASVGRSPVGWPSLDGPAVDAAGGLTAAYVHLPFCARVCPYCDFAVVAGRDDLMAHYLDALIREIEADDPWRPLDAVYIGGGTPSRVGPDGIERVLGALRARHGIAPWAEVSMEANPEDIDLPRAEAYRAVGVTRMSLGVQSFDPVVLAYLGRCHGPGEARAAVEAARAAGLSVNVDLIFGAPPETAASWERTLEATVALGSDHISTYALTVERGTALSRAVAGGAPAPDDDVQADRYEAALERLAAAGLHRYEVSNHARSGGCRYNLCVWAQGLYRAYGLGAHGHRLRRAPEGPVAVRTRNVRRLEAYLERMASGRSPQAGEEIVAGWAREQERLMLGLRRRAGVVAGYGGRALLQSRDGEALVDAGVLDLAEGRLVVRDPLRTDTVIRAVLALEPPTEGTLDPATTARRPGST